MPVIKVGENFETVIPQDLRDELGVKPGDLVQVKWEPVVDVPYTDEPLGPESQSSLARGLKDLEEGRTIGPFNNVSDLIKKLRTTPTEDA